MADKQAKDQKSKNAGKLPSKNPNPILPPKGSVAESVIKTIKTHENEAKTKAKDLKAVKTDKDPPGFKYLANAKDSPIQSVNISDSRREPLDKDNVGAKIVGTIKANPAAAGGAGLAVLAVIAVIGVAASGGAEQTAAGQLGRPLVGYGRRNATVLKVKNATLDGDGSGNKFQVGDGEVIIDDDDDDDDANNNSNGKTQINNKQLAHYSKGRARGGDLSLLFTPKVVMFTAANHAKQLAGVHRIQLRIILAPGLTKMSDSERRRVQKTIGNGVIYEGKVVPKGDANRKTQDFPIFTVNGPETRWNLTNIENPRLTILITPIRNEIKFEMKRTKTNKFSVRSKLDKEQEPLCTIDVLLAEIKKKIEGSNDIYSNQDKGCELEADLEVT